MKFGVDYSRIRAKSYFNNNTGGTFTFATDRPFDANDLTTYPTQYTQNIGDPRLRRPNDAIGVFAQDSWHVRPNFTLNYGLRYDHETAFKEATGVDDASLNLAPRFGFAWDPQNDQKTVVRGGIGQYYSKVFLNITGNIQLARAFTGVTIVNPGFPDPYSRGSVSPPSAPSTTVAPDEVHTPVTRQTSLGIKRELFGGMAVSADYVNTRGRNLYNAPDVNAPGSGHRPPARTRPSCASSSTSRPATPGTTRCCWASSAAPAADPRSGSPTRCRSRRATSRTSASRRRTTTTARPRRGRRATIADTSSSPTWSTRCRGRCRSASSRRRARDCPSTSRPAWTTTATPRSTIGPTSRIRTAIRCLASTYNANFTGRVGNLSRNFARGPGYFEAHLRVSKMLDLRRAKLDRIELFVEALNLTNHVNLDTPQGNLRSAAFGQSTAFNSDSSPRRVELGFRVDF